MILLSNPPLLKGSSSGLLYFAQSVSSLDSLLGVSRRRATVSSPLLDPRRSHYRPPRPPKKFYTVVCCPVSSLRPEYVVQECELERTVSSLTCVVPFVGPLP